MGQLTASDFQVYPTTVSQDDAITPGPTALYEVPVNDIAPTQMNEGFAEVGKKSAGFDLETPAELQADLLTDIEPVVVGPGGQLYLLDGHHTFTALLDSVYGSSDPNVFVDVVANFSNLTLSQFFTTMQQDNLLLPLNDGVPQTVNDATGAPIPTSLTALTSDPYRALEYSILKNKSSKLFTTTANITGAVGAKTPGLDKMTGFYSDFLEAAAYRDADGGRGLPYLSPGDIALATLWNLTATSQTTLPNVSGTVDAGQLPGFILGGNIVITGTISNATLAHGALDGTATGTFDESSTFASFDGVTEINAGTAQNPIIIGTPNVGFIMQLGNDNETDMLMRNSATGQFQVYDISNNTITFAAPMGQVGPEWQVAGFGDFSGRANETDMLMRNSSTGQLEVYDISNNAISFAASMGQVGLEWQVAGFGDFSGRANETDMLMRDSNTGAFEVYDIVNNTITFATGMGQVGLEWQTAGFGDFSGNTNETDMLMRDTNNGAFEVYDISKNAITLATGMGQVGLEWSVAGIATDATSAPPNTQFSGLAAASLGQVTQAIASFAPAAGTTASSPINQATVASSIAPNLLTTPNHA